MNIRLHISENIFSLRAITARLEYTLLKKQRSFHLLWGYMLLKTGLVNVLFGNILMKYCGELDWLRAVYCLLVYSFSILTCAVFAALTREV